MEEIIIRKAKINDSIKIYNNLKLCSEHMYTNLGLEHWIPVYSQESIIEDIKNKDVFLVDYRNKTVGNFILNENKSNLWQDEKNAIYLSKLAIVPEFSNRGFGKNG